jgi:prefoldin subunit 2
MILTARRDGGVTARAGTLLLRAVLAAWALSASAAGVKPALCPWGSTDLASRISAAAPLERKSALSALRLQGGDGEDEDHQEDDEERSQRDQNLIRELQGMRSQCSSLVERLSLIEQEIDGHGAAAEILRAYAPERPCKRLVGGVLIGSTVGEVLPALEDELGKLSRAASDLGSKLRERRDAMEAFKREHNIRITPGRMP